MQWQFEYEIAFIRNVEKKKHNFHVFLNVKHLIFRLFINNWRGQNSAKVFLINKFEMLYWGGFINYKLRT